MNLTDLNFQYPPELVATEPRRPSRVLLSEPSKAPQEITLGQLLERFSSNDALVINDTKVLPMRVWSKKGDEVLFLEGADLTWTVLFPAREHNIGDVLEFDGDVSAELLEKGLPQKVKLNTPLTQDFFLKCGEPALPPYIQSARGERHARPQDHVWYQTAWAERSGSIAAPTASLHFDKSDLDRLSQAGVPVAKITLHVGAGTFLPIKTTRLEDHKMHSEYVEIPHATLEMIKGRKIWALGTTVARSLESYADHRLTKTDRGFTGSTDLFIWKSEQFKMVDRLLTNFHQPQSTLLALVMAFAGDDRMREAYKFAIQNKFRLFSYGDLSAWIR